MLKSQLDNGHNTLWKFFALLSPFLFFVFLNCAGTQNTATAMDELDSSIREASNYFNGNIPKGSKLAILNLQSEYPNLSEYVVDELISNAISDRIFTVVDRVNLALIQQELTFQMSGEVSDETAVSIGQMLGAQTIISGTISKIGNLFRLRMRALDVETAQILGQFNKNILNGPTISALTGDHVASSDNAEQGEIPVAMPAQSAAPYKIGDTGPAGGIVFYDKGNSIGGWRYLEAAPAETEVTAPSFYTSSFSVDRKVGAGKENTEKYITLFQQRGGGINTAPWLCNALNVNGINDWYLPSPDELLYIYNNLYSKEIGGLKNANYWSSFIGNRGIYYINFSNGSEDSTSSTTISNQVRAIRRF